MKSKLLLTLSILLAFFFTIKVQAQSVTVLPGESPTGSRIYTGDFNYGYGTFCTFNQSKGMLSIGAQTQSNGTETWNDIRIAFNYGGTWYYIAAITNNTPSTSVTHTVSPPSSSYYLSSGSYPTITLATNPGLTYYKINEDDYSNAQNIYVHNYGNLKRYNGNYNPVGGDVTTLNNTSDLANFSLQTYPYASNQFYPASSNAKPGNPTVNAGLDATHICNYGNLPGSCIVYTDPNHAGILFNITNLPPEMLESQSFRVHIYAVGNTGADNSIYETVYNNPNFMNSPPSGLTATQNLCGKVTLNWSNSYNSLPTDGQVDLKTVIFRNGNYLDTVSNNVTTYTDTHSLKQDTVYYYTLRHVAFSESKETYFRTGPGPQVQGSMLLSPPQPISPAASADDCGGNVNLSWSYNGSNPQYFSIEYSTSATGIFTVLTNTLAGTSRNYTHAGATRGQNYYYRIYGINACGAISTSYATCNGISPADPAMATGVTVTTNTTTSVINVAWNDNANNETKYQIVRTDDQGNTTLTDINANATSYVDNLASSCKQYTYKVRVYNNCVLSGITSTQSGSATLPPPNLNTTFDAATHKLTASKGYFSNRTELNWSNLNAVNIDQFSIYRKILGSSTDSVLINTVSGTTGIYVDNTGDAGILYKYTITGQKICNGSTILTNSSEDIGFRSPTGNVSGQIEYNGSVAVKGAKVYIQPSGGNTGTSIKLSAGGALTLVNNSTLNLTNALRLEFWFKPLTTTANNSILQKTGVFSFAHIAAQYVASAVIGGTTYTVAIADSQLPINNWSHVSVDYTGTKLKIFVDGVTAASINVSPANGTLASVSNAIVIGGTGSFNMDALRLLAATAIDTTIYTDYSRYLNGTEPGFKTLLNFNEGVGSYAYDGSSQSSVYNANHFVMNNTSLVSWSTDIPTAAELSYVGITDSLGNYFVSGIPYAGVGESYNLTPSFNTHSFSPSNRTIFMGDGSSIYTGQNFTDNSSFTTTGTVFYAPNHIATCPASGAFVQIDGSIVVQNGSPVTTNDSGRFTIQVPIGPHYISLSESGHGYSAGRFPPTGTYNFQAPVSGINFTDSTVIKVIGRVVGGTRESSKPMVLGRSKNNIGKAKIVFHTLNGCYTTTVTTVDSSGDYVAYLPPLKYQIDNFTNNTLNPSYPFSDAIFNNNPLLDISNIPPVQKLVDTLFTAKDHLTWSRIDSINYQVIRSWTYRATPSVLVTTLKNKDYLTHSGDTTYVYKDDVTNQTDTLKITSNTFGYPVYSQRKNYDFKVGAIETYTNVQHSRVDSVPVSTGLFTINNALAADPVLTVKIDTVSTRSFNLDTVYYHYQFVGGNPGTNFTAGSPLNFTQQLGISFQSGANNVSWLPNTGNKPFEGILLGSKSSDGQGFVTVGPQVPQYILRDPPGSQSYASLQMGSTISHTEAWSVNENSDLSLQRHIVVGTQFLAGLGVETPTDVENDLSINAEVTSSITQDGSLQSDITTTESWQTSGSLVGADGDIFVGKAMNITFGISDNIIILPVSQCTLSGVSCRTETLSAGGNTYAVGLKNSLSCAPGGYATSFMYTQEYIVTKLIPRLTELRNNLFLTEPQKYTSHLPSSNPNYGKNNDSRVFGLPVGAGHASSLDSISTEPADTNGVSYLFKAGTTPIVQIVKSTLGITDTVTFPPSMGDSVRWYNQQIRLWVSAVSLNEQDKYESIKDQTTLQQNYSLSGGVTYNNSTQNDNTTTVDNSFELGVSIGLAAKITAKIGGSGVEVNQGLTVGVTSGGDFSNSTTHTNVSAFQLEDDNIGDSYSVDVRKSNRGYSAIFDLIAGETQCPWEGPIHSQFFTVGGQPVLLSGGTLHRELVSMKVDGSPKFSQKLNIPSNAQASFDLEIINNTETHDDISYAITVLNNSNPNGAILTIDGFNPSSQLYDVPANSSIHKTLLLAKGATVFNYDSIAVFVGSACGDSYVGDTIYVSAHFLPSCTDVIIANPLNQFVVNNSFNDTLPIVVGGYDINYNGLKDISFQFKPSAQASWIPLQSWYKYVQSIGPDSASISQSNANTFYQWAVNGIPDGNYDIQATSTCLLAANQSVVFSGIIDRVNPHLFGTPSPGDGILDPGDDISIQFNETIDAGSLSDLNFDLRGVLNGTAIRHAESLNYNGTSSYAEVVGGASLQKRDFTFEFWAKAALTNAKQTVIYQGTDVLQNLVIGFDSTNKFMCKIGNVRATCSSPIDSANWHHYAVAYNYVAQTANLFIDGALANSGHNSVIFDYIGSGKLTFGKNALTNADYLKGNIHEMRLWNKELSVSDITSTMNTVLNSNSIGLLYNWKMNEETGAVAIDDIRSRNADLYNTIWQVNPNGNAVQFNAASQTNLKIASGTVAITKEMDFTLEFWFNSSQSAAATLFSNGKGNGVGSDSLDSWNIQKDANGAIHVYHKGLDFVATNNNFFNGDWHHFALVMQRTANLSAYIDGNLQNSVQALSFVNMAGANMYLGARGYQNGPTIMYDNFYDGKMDEFRLWNTARTVEQIVRDKQNRMQGDEFGLQAFLPFEQYVSVLGVPVLTSSFNNFSVNTLNVTPQNGPTLITQTPTLKLPRPIQAVNFSYSVNNDKIIFTTTAAPNLIENVTVDITVKNVKDLHGNVMQSPVTWIAYINKNQVKWQDVELDFTKKSDSTIYFTANIVNSGGASKAYTISGLPSWLSTNATSGTIAPNSTQTINFTILPGESIGDYNADLSLTTDFGYAEILHVNLNVVGIVPTWTVNPASFQYAMNIFGQMKIDNVIATNPNNKIAAFNHGVICGVANLQYIPTYDRYEVFLNVYSNSITGDSIVFNLYDASSGLTFVNVTPTILFVENSLVGTVTNPVTFAANTEIALKIPLNTGWTWTSFPLQTTSLHNSNSLMQNLHSTSGDISLSNSGFDQYDSNLGWLGSISQGSGYFNNQSYKIHTANADTLVHVGARINPDSALATINVQPGWNWIGFVSTKNTMLATALGNYNAATGDLIKSQYEFAYYDNLNGWTGSLTTMKPGLGYMLKSAGTSTFSYPLSLFTGRYAAPNSVSTTSQSVYPFKPELYSNTMSAIIRGNICDDVLAQGTVVAAAFDASNTLRGYAYPIKVTSSNQYNFYLTVFSNSPGEALQIKYFNTTDGSLINSTQTLNFVTDAIMGTTTSPLMANVADSVICTLINSTTGISQLNGDVHVSVYPNPFSDNVILNFNQPVSCTIDLMDVLGKKVYSATIKDKAEFNMLLNGTKSSLSPGMYYIHLTGDVNQQIKVIKGK